MNIRVAAVSAFAANQLKREDPYPFCKEALDFVFIDNLNNHNKNFRSFIKNIISEAQQTNLIWEPKHTTTKLGFQTKDNIFKAGENCGKLGDIIKKEVNIYYSNYKHENCFFIKYWPNNFSLQGWYVQLRKYGHQDSHIHPNAWLSGVIYLKIINSPESNEGAIEFGLHGYDLPILDHHYPTKIFKPKMGDIVLFPSSLFHKTIPFTKDEERCVIAFDLIPSFN